MTEEQIELGKNYRCKPVGFEESVIGEVVSKMTNCAIVKVIDCQEQDELLNQDKSNMVVAKFSTFIEE